MLIRIRNDADFPKLDWTGLLSIAVVVYPTIPTALDGHSEDHEELYQPLSHLCRPT